MNEIVLKRLANITSAEALDQIALSYPDSEVFSFRRIKEAGNDNDYFVVRLKTSAAEDEAVEELPPVDDAMMSDTGEDKEDQKLDKIIDMLKDLIKKDESVHEELDAEKEDKGPAPLPKPQSPPMGTQGVGPTVGPSYASIVVERTADVSKKIARIELMREFGDEFSIGEIEKVGSIFRASLTRFADAADFLSDVAGEDPEVETEQEELETDPTKMPANISDAEFWRRIEVPEVDFDATSGNILDLAAAAEGMSPTQVYNVYRQMGQLKRKDDIQRRVRKEDGNLQMQRSPVKMQQEEVEEIGF